jgi:ATP-dependent Clp protease protease subunit
MQIYNFLSNYFCNIENFKYITNVSEEEGVMLLYSQIGNSIDKNGNISYGISGNAFANEILYLQNKCKSISVRINSIGGSVLEGYSIVSAILKSKVPCNTYIDGLAASISGVIAMAGKKCYMMDYGTLMLHNPSGMEDKEVLGLVKNTLVTIFQNRTDLDSDNINTMMDTETWLSASECLSRGMIDSIVSSGKKIKMPTNNLEEMAFCYNQLINPKNEIMEDKNAELIKSKDAEIAELNLKLDALKKEISDKLESEKLEKATELVNKFNVIEDKDSLIELAKNNYDTVEKLLSKVGTVMNAVKVFDAANVIEEEEEESYSELQKNNPKKLQDMYVNEPEKFKELLNKHLKIK